MSTGQVRRYGKQLLQVIDQGRKAPAPSFPKRTKRPPDHVLTRYEKLHTWRKERARERGVESDVIVSRNALQALAAANPGTEEELRQIEELSDWHRQTYGKEILEILQI
jgi:ribonuclease D